MVDPFENIRQLYRTIEQFRAWEADQHRVAAQFADAAKLRMQLDTTVGIPEFLRNMQLTSSEQALLVALKPTVAELAMLQMNRITIASTYDSVRKLIPPDAGGFATIAKQEAVWHQRMKGILAIASKNESLTESIQKSLVAQEISLMQVAEALRASSVFNRNDALAMRLFAPHHAYADFASMTAVRLAKETSSSSASALRASLRLAESQIVSTSDALSRMLIFNADLSGEVLISEEPMLIVPSTQQQEFLDTGGELPEEDIDALIDASPTAQTATIANRILILITLCNEASRVAGKGDVFKPTNRMLEAFARLPWELANGKKQLADIIDCLFWTLYEGAGEDNLRYLRDHGGWMEPGDCAVIFRIKFLRNKWLRHDPDHGEDTKIEKGWRDVSKVLIELGLSRIPTTEAEYRRIHRALLEQVEAFLQVLLTRIGSQGN